jgi:uncharacterized protein (DUF433 family)
MEIAPHITVDPAIHHGIPVSTGTRVPVSIIIGSLAGGMSKEEVMQEYELTKIQIEAALSYATDLIKQTEVTALGAFQPGLHGLKCEYHCPILGKDAERYSHREFDYNDSWVGKVITPQMEFKLS